MEWAIDIFESLKRHHRTVFDIFQKLGSTRDITLKEILFLQLKEELEIHAQIEKNILHTALEGNSQSCDLALSETEECFETMRDLLSELEILPPEDRLWKRKVFELKLSFQTHVDEEDEILSSAQTLLSEDQIADVGLRAEEIKEWL